MKEVESILKDIESGKIAPIYFLMGEEVYFIDEISNYIANNVLSEQEKGFNQMVVYGKETRIADIISSAKRYPMMAPYQVIIVKEAQALPGNIDDLCSYIEYPQPQTILVFCYKHKVLDKRKKITKLLSQGENVLFESKPLKEHQVSDWIKKYVTKKQRVIDVKAVEMLVEFIGTDLSRIANELEKLFIVCASSITPEDIEKNIGVSKDYNIFELQRALIEKDTQKTLQIINYFSEHSTEHPVIKIVSVLYSFFQKVLLYHGLKDFSDTNAAAQLKISPYFVKDYRVVAQRVSMRSVSQILEKMRTLDARSKGVDIGQVSSSQLYKELFLLLSGRVL